MCNQNYMFVGVGWKTSLWRSLLATTTSAGWLESRAATWRRSRRRQGPRLPSPRKSQLLTSPSHTLELWSLSFITWRTDVSVTVPHLSPLLISSRWLIKGLVKSWPLLHRLMKGISGVGAQPPNRLCSTSYAHFWLLIFFLSVSNEPHTIGENERRVMWKFELNFSRFIVN